ncbi:DUF2680 domain-containing protein [Acetobacterium wieringae]|uniref:DUF2680 domain-containing protein n=1 Tax=Acetobacterium wieringae TaxID=52694 RepID=UPI0026EA383A|nr:DUF2680 domain-containing protein [Acetobacterium wieringae]
MKKVLMILAVLLLVIVPTGVFAATSDSQAAQNFRGLCGFRVDSSTLTEQQKTDLTDSFNQMITQRKESIAKFVADGLMTQEQADLALARLDNMVERQQDGYFGMMGGFGRGGMMGGGAGCYDADDY